MEKTKSPWSVPVAAQDIPETGLHRDIEASAATRGELAKLAGLHDLPRLSASFDLERRGAGVRVRGRVSALVGQTCVVSLEPMESEVDEPVDVTFAPLPPGAEAADSDALGQYLGDGAKEPPEPLIGGTVDLGALATEFMVLGIDPYPRKPGAAFTPPNVGDESANPFAALAALKKRPGGGRP
jgi:hypothetical protein